MAILMRICFLVNIPDGFTSAVRWYGNHFLHPFLCIPNHNFCWDIGKDCYASQLRHNLDQYLNRNGKVVKHKKGDFRVPALWFPNFRKCDFIAQDYSLISTIQIYFFFYQHLRILSNTKVVGKQYKLTHNSHEYQQH